MRPAFATRVVAVGVLSTALAACTGAARSNPTATASASTSTAPGGLAGDGGEQSPAPRSTILTTPRPSLTPPNGVKEVDGTCPYISSQDFADGEGDRVGRVTLLLSKPVGCRFYFAYDPSVIVGQISVNTFGTATEAFNAMVLSAKGHPEVQSSTSIGAGAVLFQTDLQGTQAWQCVFAKGTRVVTVRTRQPYPALNAENLARAIAPRIS
ncbi:MAG TPA: hypothetical protein VHO01_13765 [Jatrophihabitans sp.]|nr:hypothetical protein [Jatrophihabitans sp.]